MKTVVIVGGGLIGLCSAYYLAAAGFEVTVVERNTEASAETSRQNGGLLTPSMSDPWNAPGVHRDLLRYLGKPDAPMRIRPSAIHHYLRWGAKFLANSTPAKYRAATLANYALGRLAVRNIGELRQSLGLEYSCLCNGTMKVFRTAERLAVTVKAAEVLESHGLRFKVLDGLQTGQREPALRDIQDQIVGSVYYPDDESGDAHEFSLALAAALVSRGVTFEFGTAATKVLVERNIAVGISSTAGDFRSDAVIIAAGHWSPALVPRSAGRPSIMPVKGYSLSIPLKPGSYVPGIAIVDDDMHAAVTPIGSTLRVAGTAEFGGWNTHIDETRIRNLWQLLSAIGPSLYAAADRDSAIPWCGLRPMSADGIPYIGETRVKGLLLNTGHGHLGWTQAAGAGMLLAQQMSGVAASIRSDAFSPKR